MVEVGNVACALEQEVGPCWSGVMEDATVSGDERREEGASAVNRSNDSSHRAASAGALDLAVLATARTFT